MKIFVVILGILLFSSIAYAVYTTWKDQSFHAYVIAGELQLYQDSACTTEFPETLSWDGIDTSGGPVTNSVDAYLKNEANLELELTWNMTTAGWTWNSNFWYEIDGGDWIFQVYLPEGWKAAIGIGPWKSEDDANPHILIVPKDDVVHVEFKLTCAAATGQQDFTIQFTGTE